MRWRPVLALMTATGMMLATGTTADQPLVELFGATYVLGRDFASEPELIHPCEQRDADGNLVNPAGCAHQIKSWASQVYDDQVDVKAQVIPREFVLEVHAAMAEIGWTGEWSEELREFGALMNELSDKIEEVDDPTGAEMETFLEDGAKRAAAIG